MERKDEQLTDGFRRLSVVGPGGGMSVSLIDSKLFGLLGDLAVHTACNGCSDGMCQRCDLLNESHCHVDGRSLGRVEHMTNDEVFAFLETEFQFRFVRS